MSGKNGKKLDIRKIVLIILAAALIIGVVTGRISLADLFGTGGQTPAVTESAAISTEAATRPPASTASGAAEKTSDAPDPSSLTIGSIESVTFPSNTGPTKTTTTAAETTKDKDDGYVEYRFRNKSLLTQHYEKHGEEMGFANAQDYQKAASDIINEAGNNGILSKYKSDGSGDQCFYVEKTKEFVVLSYDGFIRTYFICSGIKYFNRQ